AAATLTRRAPGAAARPGRPLGLAGARRRESATSEERELPLQVELVGDEPEVVHPHALVERLEVAGVPVRPEREPRAEIGLVPGAVARPAPLVAHDGAELQRLDAVARLDAERGLARQGDPGAAVAVHEVDLR